MGGDILTGSGDEDVDVPGVEYLVLHSSQYGCLLRRGESVEGAGWHDRALGGTLMAGMGSHRLSLVFLVRNESQVPLSPAPNKQKGLQGVAARKWGCLGHPRACPPQA